MLHIDGICQSDNLVYAFFVSAGKTIQSFSYPLELDDAQSSTFQKK